mgnify:CR=1 FL=1
MTCILLVTVGGSPEPILYAVRSLRRELAPSTVEVVFICSVDPCQKPSLPQVVGEGFPCFHMLPDGSKEVGANLLLQLDINRFEPARQLIGLPDPDDLADAYRRIRDHIQFLRDDGFRGRILGDYTGGTKSMSAALAMACVQLGEEVGVVTGPRTNLEKVDQSATTRLMDIAPLQAMHRLETQLVPILDLHNYGEAAQIVWEFRTVHERSLAPDSLLQVQELQAVFQLLESWDQFQWKDALNLANNSSLALHSPYLLHWWKRVVMARDCMDGQPPGDGMTGYELVQDLLLSAERRGRRGWFDDAVARLYRALELLAQTYITLELKTTPESRWEKDRCFLIDGTKVEASGEGINAIYMWLERREGRSGLGGIFGRRRGQFYRLLRARNSSLLAHGFSPLAEGHWRDLQRDITSFVDDILKQDGFEQGPPPQQLPGSSLLALPAARHLFGPASQDPLAPEQHSEV